jgi:hypothetical protein
MNRRGFLGTILALGCAPAIVRAHSLMPVRVLEEPVIVVVNQMPQMIAQAHASYRAEAKARLALWLQAELNRMAYQSLLRA